MAYNVFSWDDLDLDGGEKKFQYKNTPDEYDGTTMPPLTMKPKTSPSAKPVSLKESSKNLYTGKAKNTPTTSFDITDEENVGGMSGLGTIGNKVGIATAATGTALNAATTIINRLGDRPNSNTFMTYAEDAIKTMNDSKRYAQNMFDYALQDIDFSEAGARRTITQNARGINQQRALQLGLHAQGQDARRKARVDYAGSMLGINRDVSRLQERHDYYSMSAEERKQDKDKADRDAFFSNLSSNITDATMFGQQLGHSLNQSLETQQRIKMAKEYGKYSFLDEDFDLIGKPQKTTP